MKNILFILLFTALSLPAYSKDYTQKLDELMNDFNKVEMFSGVVMLAKDGVPVYEKSFGYADWESKSVNTPQTIFNIGSINKTFTQAIILQLEKEGKVNTADNIGKYLKMYGNELDDKITIRMLMEMKAGLDDYLRNPEFRDNPEKFKTVNDFLTIIRNEPLLFEPGTGQEYSNSGYAVLGGIIEAVTGKSYQDNLKERFFIPLGMSSSYYRQIGDIVPNPATGTMITFKGSKIGEPFHSMPSPAGGIFMNAGDMLKFDNELRKTKLMPLRIMAGGTPGWNAILAQYDGGYSLIVLSNFTRAAEEVESRFRSILKGESYSPPQLSMEMQFYTILKNEGASGLKSKLKEIIEANDLEYRAAHLNMFGYALMRENEIDDAIEVFKLNTELFPNNPNVWDSLGEAYMNRGDKEKAIENYKKAIELAPQNENAKKMLEKLQAK